MADSSVTTTFFANERDAQAAIVRLEKKYADLEAKIGSVGRRSHQSADSGVLALRRWVTNVATLSAGYLALPALIGHVTAANREMIQQADEASLKYNKLFTRFRVQTGQGALQTGEAKKRIISHAVRNAVPVEYAETMAEELVGEGFSPEEGSGPALRTMLETVRATGMGEADPRQLAKAAAMFLSAQGKPKTDANLRPVMIAIQRLFKETSLKLEDMVDLAGRTELAAGSLSTEETLAVFDLIRQKNPGDVASTAFKIIIDRLQTIKARPGDVAMLRRIGLKPGDVDLVGEDIATVLDRLAAGLDTVTPEIQNVVLSALFEERARSPAQGLIRDRKKLPEILAKMRDIAGFEADVGVATSGTAAAKARSEAIRERLHSDRDTGFEAMLRSAETIALEKGASPLAISTGLAASRALKYLGLSDETAFNWAMGGTIEAVSKSGEPRALDQVRLRDDALIAGGARQIKVLEDILEELRKRNPRREGLGAP